MEILRHSMYNLFSQLDNQDYGSKTITHQGLLPHPFFLVEFFFFRQMIQDNVIYHGGYNNFLAGQDPYPQNCLTEAITVVAG